MSSVWTGSKVVLAHANTAGEPRYALFEKYVCSNVSPRVPRIECIGYGSIEQVLKIIFTGASNAESGCVKGAGGQEITPHGYIRQWMMALAKPQVMNTRLWVAARLFKADSFFDQEAIDAAGILRQHGFEDEAVELETKKGVSLDLVHHEVALDAMCNSGRGGRYSSRIIARSVFVPSENSAVTYCPELAYNPKRHQGRLPDGPEVMRVISDRPAENSIHFVRTAEGRWLRHSAQYRVMCDYIEGLAAQELETPKAYTRLIAAFRQQVQECREVAIQDMALHVDNELADTMQKELSEMAEEYAVERGPAQTLIKPKPEAVKDSGMCGYYLSQLQDRGAYWLEATSASQAA